MELVEAALDAALDGEAHVVQGCVDLVELHGGVLAALVEAGKAADMALAGDDGGDAVDPAGDGPGGVEGAEAIVAEQGAAHALAGSLLHDGLRRDALLLFAEEVALQAGELAVDLRGAFEDGGALGAKAEGLAEGLADVHGLDQSEVEERMAAVAAALAAGHALRALGGQHLGEDAVHLVAELFVGGKNR